jgi:hypothetical protein
MILQEHSHPQMKADCDSCSKVPDTTACQLAVSSQVGASPPAAIGGFVMMRGEPLMDQQGQIPKLLKDLAGFRISGDAEPILRMSEAGR